jgi:hypothetical protein
MSTYNYRFFGTDPHHSEPEWASGILAMYQSAGILFIMKCLIQMLVAAKANEWDDFSRVITHFCGWINSLESLACPDMPIQDIFILELVIKII